MSDQLHEIQEDLIEYFDDMDNKTFVDVVDILVYHKGTSNGKISQLADKFLKDNGLNEAYMNYLIELKNPSQFFTKHPTDIKMVEQIKQSLLSLSHNRLYREVKKSKPKSLPLIKLSRGEKDDLRMVIESCERDNDNLIEEDKLDSIDTIDVEEANDIKDERNRLSKLYTKVLKIIK